MSPTPMLTIGMPVRNGAAYLREALESLRVQSFTDFEVVVSDNASTDATAAICREFADRDRRFRCIRFERTVGITENFNSVLHQARSVYFKWMAHDDEIEPTLIEKCIDVLEKDPTVVIAHAAEREIDEFGRELPLGWQSRQCSDSPNPCTRFRYLCWDHPCYPIFGVIRTEALRQTGAFGHYPSSDRVVLAELSLHGRIVRIPERLFLHREHGDRAGRNTCLQYQQRHITPERPEKTTFPHFRMALEYLRAINRSPLGFGRRQCCRAQVARWALRGWRNFIDDVTFQLGRIVRQRGQGRGRDDCALPSTHSGRAGRTARVTIRNGVQGNDRAGGRAGNINREGTG